MALCVAHLVIVNSTELFSSYIFAGGLTFNKSVQHG